MIVSAPQGSSSSDPDNIPTRVIKFFQQLPHPQMSLLKLLLILVFIVPSFGWLLSRKIAQYSLFREEARQVVKFTNPPAIKPLLNLQSLCVLAYSSFTFSWLLRTLLIVFEPPAFVCSSSSYYLRCFVIFEFLPHLVFGLILFLWL